MAYTNVQLWVEQCFECMEQMILASCANGSTLPADYYAIPPPAGSHLTFHHAGATFDNRAQSLANLSTAATTGTASALSFKADGNMPIKWKQAIQRETDYGHGHVSVLMSTVDFTLEDFWFEFSCGQNGNPPIRELEEEGIDWQCDPKGSTKFKTFWGYCSPIYNLIMHYIEREGSQRKYWQKCNLYLIQFQLKGPGNQILINSHLNPPRG